MFSQLVKKISCDIDKYLYGDHRIENIMFYDFADKLLLEAMTSVKELNDGLKGEHNLEKSANIKKDRFSGQIFPIVPLYLTNICNQTCLYCNYSRFNDNIKRIRLNNEELLLEVEHLVKEKGYKSIELVYTTDPHLEIKDIARQIEITKNYLVENNGNYVGINAQSFAVDEYKYLIESGLDFVVLWQETYEEERYSMLHPYNKEKSNFTNRLDTYENIYQAGVKRVGLGILSGLQKDWIKDWAMLFMHEAYLKWKFNKPISILGIPRLKGINEIDYFPKIECSHPSDDQFLDMIAIHNIYSPTTLPFINTRENWDLCSKLANGGGCLFTFDCSTYPGGYTRVGETFQFPTYNHKIEEYCNVAKGNNLFPNFNWTFPT